MDKITKDTLAELRKLKQDLQKWETRLNKVGKTHIPTLYFSVPLEAQKGFLVLYGVLDDMKRQLQQKSSHREG